MHMMMHSSRRRPLVIGLLGLLLLGLLALGASMSERQSGEALGGATSPDGMPFRGPTAPPPANPDFMP